MRMMTEARWQRMMWIGVLLFCIATSVLAIHYQPWWAALVTCLTLLAPIALAVGGILLL